jgi:hypothetical protein
MERNSEFQKIVDSWPADRIAELENRCSVPRTRVAALLGIGQTVLSQLVKGRYTPSAVLCRRMEELERMAERGEIHGQYVPDKADLQRRLALFRQWFMDKPPTKDFPLVTVSVKFQWGASFYSSVTLPIEHLPQLRLTKWSGLVEIVRTLTVALRTLARANSRLMWKEQDAAFWRAYATDSLPKIVESRAQSIEARLEKGRNKRGLRTA